MNIEENQNYQALIKMQKLVHDAIITDRTISKVELVGMMWECYDLGKQRERRNYMTEA